MKKELLGWFNKTLLSIKTKNLKPGQSLFCEIFPETARAWLALCLALKEKTSLIWVFKDSAQLLRWQKTLMSLNQILNLNLPLTTFFTAWENKLSGEVLTSLRNLRSSPKGIYLFTGEILALNPPSYPDLKSRILTLQKGELKNLTQFINLLVDRGFRPDPFVVAPGFFYKRGGIIDVFPPNYNQPLKIEFVENTIKKIMIFNPISKDIEKEIEKAEILPFQFKLEKRGGWKEYLKEDSILILPDPDDFDPGTLSKIFTAVKHMRQLIWVTLAQQNSINLHYHLPPLFFGQIKNLSQTLSKWQDKQFKIYIFSHWPEKLKSNPHFKKFKKLNIFRGSLEEGFLNEKDKIALLTDREIWGEFFEEKIRSQKRELDLSFLTDLNEGDYVVHLDHGIGIFRGIKENVVEGINREYFCIEYAEKDKLYVPVTQADKLSKYIGQAHPPLHRLSGAHWYQLTHKIKVETRQIAQNLLKIYAQRELVKVEPFKPKTLVEEELEASFPYEETPDQIKALNEIEKDLTRGKPMDRLICGDVGFGKTEIAIRAAFKAKMNGKQVVVLAPTTILTQQHFDTFQERLKNFPVKIEMLSRLKTPKEQQEILARVKKGEVDILIGTHRLLSVDVQFKDLGLIIIDEEQRFGVKQKEKLKSLRLNAHVLTLTATPIPRTLHFALSNLKDVSIISTPPLGRLPVQNFIQPYSEKIVKEAILRELKRKGQVYYLHNRIATIAQVAEKLRKLIPKAKIGYIHGRLPEKEIMKVMSAFDRKKIDVLVSTTIIENGLDLPNVNTLIVEDATRYGLAELYQLRGRIGRGLRQAYAYFLYKKENLKEAARKRLQALLEAKALGSGFQLALRDLEIRGVGTLLGLKQHGSVHLIGLNLYLRLLNQAIEELKTGKLPPPRRDIPVELPIEARLPASFIPRQTERIKLYQRLASIDSISELRKEKKRLGENLPQPVKNLFEIFEIIILAQETPVLSIETHTRKELNPPLRFIVLKLLNPLPENKQKALLRLNNAWQIWPNQLKIELSSLGKDWLNKLKEALKTIQVENKI